MMNLQVQECLFDKDRDEVRSLFLGENYSRTEDHYGYGDPIQVMMNYAPMIQGNWCIVFHLTFQAPEIFVSDSKRRQDSAIEFARRMNVAMIELEQRRRKECRAILHFLPDTARARMPHALQGWRDWAFGVGQERVGNIWRRTIDEWEKNQLTQLIEIPDKRPSKKETKFTKWRKAYSVIVWMRKEYQKRFDDDEIDSPKVKLREYRESLNAKRIYYKERTIRKIIKEGDAGRWKKVAK
jgi:hypothetical protein